MLGTKRSQGIPLPKGWSRLVRSAIVHTVSMATIAFTHALARAANNSDAQIRAQAEIDRLQREIDLLLEEGRIKDARMERLPAQRRRKPRGRFIKSMKNECTRLLPVVPMAGAAFDRELDHYVAWYNAVRPRFEPRARWPRRSPCASPQALVRGRPGVVVELHVTYHAGRKHLPVVSLKRVA